MQRARRPIKSETHAKDIPTNEALQRHIRVGDPLLAHAHAAQRGRTLENKILRLDDEVGGAPLLLLVGSSGGSCGGRRRGKGYGPKGDPPRVKRGFEKVEGNSAAVRKQEGQ